MEMMNAQQINEGLRMNGGVAGKLPNMRQVDPTKAINKELINMQNEMNKERNEMNERIIEVEMVENEEGLVVVAATNNNNTANEDIVNVDDCVEIITEGVEWVKDSFDLIYGKSYEGGIRYTDSLEPLMTW